jgi:hypothetical protein
MGLHTERLWQQPAEEQLSDWDNSASNKKSGNDKNAYIY